MEVIEKQMDIVERALESAKRWRSFSACLLIVIIVLLSSVATIIVYYELIRNPLSVRSMYVSKEATTSREPRHPSIFRDLTKSEITSVYSYVYSENTFNVKEAVVAALNRSFLYLIELHLPNKSLALENLDMGLRAPPREARVIIFRGDKSIPVIEEYILGPLPNISYHRLFVSKHYQRPAPYLFRPMSTAEQREINRLLQDLDRKLKSVLEESYEASFFNCGSTCLVLNEWTPMSPIVSGKDKRKVWYSAHQKSEYYLLNPVDLFILFDLDGNDVNDYAIASISYAGRTYGTAEQLLDAYMSDITKKSTISFPTKFSRPFNAQNSKFPKQDIRSSTQIEPDGKRYFIHDRHVTYLNWGFDFRMSTITGPQLFNVKHQGQRIIYELGLQEVSTFHSGFQPWNRYSDILHSNSLLGYNAKNLIPGVDCPTTASFISATHAVEGGVEHYSKAFCLFEQSSLVPLKRHFSNDESRGKFYEGLDDIIMVLRSIIVSWNYDFIVDFIFHQNGAIEVKTTTSGFAKSAFYSPTEGRYGYQLKDNLIGTACQHAFHFKVDLDINGSKNRYETLQIETNEINNNDWSTEPGSKYEQLKFTRNLKMSENQTPYRHNSTVPTFHLFFNKIHKTNYNDARSYRIHINGGMTQLLSENFKNEASISWSRHQLAVTCHKDDEAQSSSIYSMWDAREPIVKFQNFLEDNENIIDMDLVAWVTLGMYYLPHMEDLPLMTSIEKRQSFYIMPFNFYDHDQSDSSRDSLKMSPDKRYAGGINIDNNGLQKDFVCHSEYKVKNQLTNFSDVFH